MACDCERPPPSPTIFHARGCRDRLRAQPAPRTVRLRQTACAAPCQHITSKNRAESSYTQCQMLSVSVHNYNRLVLTRARRAHFRQGSPKPNMAAVKLTPRATTVATGAGQDRPLTIITPSPPLSPSPWPPPSASQSATPCEIAAVLERAWYMYHRQARNLAHILKVPAQVDHTLRTWQSTNGT